MLHLEIYISDPTVRTTVNDHITHMAGQMKNLVGFQVCPEQDAAPDLCACYVPQLPSCAGCHIPCRSRDRTPTSDPDRTHRTSWTSLRTFCSTYMLLTHYLHVSLGPHSGLRLSPDTGPTPLHHPVYPSALPTLFVFTRLHPLPCTGP